MPTKKLAIFIGPILLVFGLIFLISSRSETGASKISIPTIEKHRGVCWVGGPQEIGTQEIETIARLGVNWISQTPFGWQRGYNNPKIGTNKQIEQRGYQAWWGERDEGLRETTRIAKKEGIKTVLKPHIWLRDEEGKWRGEIAMDTEEDWREWFSNYEEFILHYAQLAEEEKMEMLCIGTELHRTCVEREADWRSLIQKIRNVYSGQLTYAANFSDEYEDVAFWDALDFIGIQGYFPVNETPKPSIEASKKGWQKHIDNLEAFSNRYNKPILFTEIGYKSTSDAGIEPWQWPQRISKEERQKIFSEETQANLYEAMFESLMTQPFVAGLHIWKWYPKYENSTRRPDRTMANIDFTPQGKKAEEVMSKWFNKLAQ